MKIIFFGTPDYVVPLLESLHKIYNKGLNKELIAVVTQEPKPVGRDKQLEYSAVDTFAHKHKIPIYFLNEESELPEADLGICAAYGKIISKEVIDHFPLGILNIHPSLLPQFRGASPTQAAILSGLTETGVSVIKMDEGMDTGDIISSFKSQIDPTDTNETLRARLFLETVEFLADLIPNYVKNKINLKKQKNEDATITKTLKKDDGYLEESFFSQVLTNTNNYNEKEIRFLENKKFVVDAFFVDRFIKALYPWPGVWTFVKLSKEGGPKRIKLLKSHLEDGNLVIDEVQLEGKNPVSFEQFIQGYPSIFI